jgi:hypothetical protein
MDMRADQRPERKGGLLVFILATVGVPKYFFSTTSANSFLSATQYVVEF